MLRTIELSLLPSCPVGCCYCPQPLLKAVSRDRGIRKAMSEDVLRGVVANVSEGRDAVELHWAGFTEPLKHPRFASLLRLSASLPFVASHVIYTTGEGMTDDRLEAISDLGSKLRSITFHISAKQAMGRDDDVMPGARGDLWKFVDDGSIKRHLPQATFNVVSRVNRDLRRKIRVRVGQRVHFSRQISRSDNLARSQNKPAAVTHVGPVVCMKTTDKKMPVVCPDGLALACCNDYGFELPLGNLYFQRWSDLDYSGVREYQRRSTADSICHTDCHYAKVRPTTQ